jgi:5-methylcytosine-specific restriction endonuclease McrA
MDNLKKGKLDCNNPEVNQREQAPGLKVTVFVLSINGNPLMPCTSAKARRLLKEEKAHVIKQNPFIIKLNFECENKTQAISLGIDTGFSNVGFSAITEKKELVSGILVFEEKTKKRLIEKKMYRRLRRSRLRYRKPRFNNRTKKEGWLPPSTQRKFDTHLTLINAFKKYLPISKVIIEVGKFDIQKINNPEIEGKGYQEGDLLGYYNLRSFITSREKNKCQLCGKEMTKDNSSHLHHIISRKDGGTDKPSNIALLHKTCHKRLHEEKLFSKLKKSKEYRAETFMSIIGKRFKDIPGFNFTYGYITSIKRNKQKLEKTHYNDAFIIAGGNEQKKVSSIEVKQKRRNNRTLQTNRKGFIPSIRRKRYKIQNRDFVWIKGKRYLCGGVQGKGASVYVFDKKKEKSLISVKRVERVYHTESLVW